MTSSGARRRAAALLALACALLPGSPGAAPASPPALTEYQVKAGFLYNFAALIEWPPATPPTLTLCIVGDDPFGAAGEAIEGKAVGERALAVRKGVPVAELRACQIVFVAPSESERLPAILDSVRDQPILTVGDRPGLAARGLVAGFYADGSKVRFEINVDAARRAQLTISSRLLNLARIVHDAEAAR